MLAQLPNGEWVKADSIKSVGIRSHGIDTVEPDKPPRVWMVNVCFVLDGIYSNGDNFEMEEKSAIMFRDKLANEVNEAMKIIYASHTKPLPS